MHIRNAVTLLTALTVIALPLTARADAPAIDAFNAAFAKVTSYTYKLHSHQTKGGASQTRVYEYSFMKPNNAKTLIDSGDNQGSGGVWTGGNQVSGHQGGILSGIHLKVDLHDSRATSLRGYTIPDGLLQNIVGNLTTIKGEVHQYPGGVLGGVDTDLVIQKVDDPASDGGITERRIYFSKASHFPVRSLGYEGSTLVLDEAITDLNLDANLSQADFPF